MILVSLYYCLRLKSEGEMEDAIQSHYNHNQDMYAKKVFDALMIVMACGCTDAHAEWLSLQLDSAQFREVDMQLLLQQTPSSSALSPLSYFGS